MMQEFKDLRIQLWCKRSLLLSIVAILIASVVPLGSGASTKTVYSVGFDKILHCLAFGWIAVLSFAAVRTLGLRTGVYAVACVMVFGVAIELVQYPIPYRTFNPVDIFANTCGVILGALLWIPISFRSRINSKTGPQTRLPHVHADCAMENRSLQATRLQMGK